MMNTEYGMAKKDKDPTMRKAAQSLAFHKQNCSSNLSS